MHGFGDFDAPLNSGAFISLVECITRALTLGASRLFWELPRHPLCDFAFLSGLLWDSFGFLRFLASLGPSALLRAFVPYCPGFSGTVFVDPDLSGSLPVFSRDAWFG